MTNRPICVHCGAQYGQRDTQDEIVKFRVGDPEPPYLGNAKLIRSKTWKATGSGSTRARFSGPLVHYQIGDALVRRTVWEGQWMGGCPPFCTNRCAIDYACQAFKRYGALK